jgi:hypothetical protein
MKKLGNKIARVMSTDVERLVVKLVYEDGSTVDVSLASLFSPPRGLAAEVMRGGLFDKCYVESGALAWPNGLELCPDALLMENVALVAKRGGVQRRAR